MASNKTVQCIDDNDFILGVFLLSNYYDTYLSDPSVDIPMIGRIGDLQYGSDPSKRSQWKVLDTKEIEPLEDKYCVFAFHGEPDESTLNFQPNLLGCEIFRVKFPDSFEKVQLVLEDQYIKDKLSSKCLTGGKNGEKAIFSKAACHDPKATFMSIPGMNVNSAKKGNL